MYRTKGWAAGLVLIAACWAGGSFSNGKSAAAADADKVIGYAELLKLVTDKTADTEIIKQLEASPTIFTLGTSQVDELKKAGASPAVLESIKKKHATLELDPGLEINDLAIILDCSGSMAEKTGNQTKMEAAKPVVEKLIRGLPHGMKVSFIIYGHDRALGCNAVSVMRPLSVLGGDDKEALIKQIQALQPVGGTPISLGLKVAGAELMKGSGPRGIILITDGMETCAKENGAPDAMAKKLAADLDLRKLAVVGYGLNDKEKAAVEAIAKATDRGSWYDAQDADQLAAVGNELGKFVAQAAEPPPGEAVGDPINLAARANGGTLLDIPGEYSGEYGGANLIEAGTEYYSAPAAHPLAAVIGFKDGQACRISAVAVNPNGGKKDNWVRQVEIEVSNTAPFTGFKKVGIFDVPATGDDAVLELNPPRVGRYVRFRFLKNGGGDYMSLGELMIVGTPVGDAPPVTRYVNMAAAKNGGKALKVTSQYSDDWVAGNLLDGSGGRPWCSSSGESQSVVIQLGKPSTVTHVTVNPYCESDIKNWVSNAEVFLSNTDAIVGFKSAGKLAIKPVGEDHVLELKAPTPAKYLKVVFLSNAGGEYMVANEVKAFTKAD